LVETVRSERMDEIAEKGYAAHHKNIKMVRL
jgi:(p)ppGpp synthase/HD superfamily hydrolase